MTYLKLANSILQAEREWDGRTLGKWAGLTSYVERYISQRFSDLKYYLAYYKATHLVNMIDRLFCRSSSPFC